MLLKQVTPATAQPVTLEEAKSFLRVEHNSEDATIGTFIRAAVSACRKLARISFMPEVWEVIYDLPRFNAPAFGLGLSGVYSKGAIDDPDRINSDILLPWGPVRSVSAMTLTDADGVTASVAGTYYSLTGTNQLVWKESFRELMATNRTVTIRYATGFADKTAIDAQGSDLVTAILMTVAVIYEHRGLSNVVVPPAARGLLNGYWSSPTY